jgi:hypothetical protein
MADCIAARTIRLLKRYRFMRFPVFGQQIVWSLTAIAIVVLTMTPDATAARQNFRSQSPAQWKAECTRMNVRCPRKKVTTSKRKTTKNRKQAESKPAKPVSKRRTDKSTLSKKALASASPNYLPETVLDVPKPLPEVNEAALGDSEKQPAEVQLTAAVTKKKSKAKNVEGETELQVPKPAKAGPLGEPKASPNAKGEAKPDTYAALEPAPMRLEKVQPSATGAECLNDLARLGAVFSVPKEIEVSDVCHIANPVKLTSVQTSEGTVKLAGSPLLNCEFARQFVTWVSYVAAPITGGLEPARLSSILTGTSYQCRQRNGDNSDKMSEHAFGNAIDIAGFLLANRKKVEVADVSDPTDQRLLMTLHATACGYFTTVLGPGSNAAHASHYHFDMIKRGKSGTSRICGRSSYFSPDLGIHGRPSARRSVAMDRGEE